MDRPLQLLIANLNIIGSTTSDTVEAIEFDGKNWDDLELDTNDSSKYTKGSDDSIRSRLCIFSELPSYELLALIQDDISNADRKLTEQDLRLIGQIAKQRIKLDENNRSAYYKGIIDSLKPQSRRVPFVPPHPSEKSLSWEKKFDAVLGALPTELAKLTAELGDATHGYRQAVAKRLEPVLNAHLANLQTTPQGTLEQKKAIQEFVASVLEPLGLAVQCPKTGRPGKIKATTGNKPDSSSFHYEIYIDGKREFTSVTDELPRLTLMDGHPPLEAQTHFRDLVKRSLTQVKTSPAAVSSTKQTGYSDVTASFAESTTELRRSFIARFLPAFKDEIQLKKHETYEDKKELVKWINAELRRFDLAIKSPTTGNPSFFKANAGNHPQIGRFQLVSKDAEGAEKIFSTPKLETLLEKLELMDAPERREAIVEWQEKVGRDRHGAKRS